MVELLTFGLSLSVSLNLLWQSMAAAESALFDEQLISPLIRKLQDDSASSLPLQEYGKKAYEMTLDEPNLKKKFWLFIKNGFSCIFTVYDPHCVGSTVLAWLVLQPICLQMTTVSLCPMLELQASHEVFTVGSWSLTNPWHRSMPFCSSTLACAVESFSRVSTENRKDCNNMVSKNATTHLWLSIQADLKLNYWKRPRWRSYSGSFSLVLKKIWANVKNLSLFQVSLFL